MASLTTIRIVRILFTLVCVGLGVMYGFGMFGRVGEAGDTKSLALVGGLCGLGLAGLLIFLDILLRAFTIRSFTSATVGLMIGVLCAWLITRLPLLDLEANKDWVSIAATIIYCSLGYLGMVIALRSNQQEFSLIIPYVRFRNEGVLRQSHVVDQGAITDGRLPQLFATGLLNGAVVVPRYILDNLKNMADSERSPERLVGRRGLECLDALQKLPKLQVSVQDLSPHSRGQLEKSEDPAALLISLALSLEARLLTRDANLASVAQLRGVECLNFAALADALRPSHTVGDQLDLTLVKEGRDDHQAVGYASDGTMIVVNHARHRLHATVSIVVSSSVQTTAGKLIFAELLDSNGSTSSRSADEPGSTHAKQPELADLGRSFVKKAT